MAGEGVVEVVLPMEMIQTRGGRGGHGGGLVYLLLEELTLDGTIESKGNNTLQLSM